MSWYKIPLNARAVLGALAVLAVFAVFRWDACQRTQALFLADSAEYLMLAQGLVGGNDVPVEPVRSNFFSLFLAVPLFLREWLTADDAPYDSSLARIVPLAFHLFTCLGTYRLGRLAAGPAAGWLAAIVIAVLPEFSYWGIDYLTDAPAAACIVWGAALWIEGRAVHAGVMLGLAVLFRYQSLISLAAFFPLPLLARRPKDLLWLSVGVLGPMLLLGVLDWLYWGMPFESLINFAKKQMGSFVPVEVVPTLQAERGSAVTSKGAWWYYFGHAPSIFTWPLVVAFLLFLAGRWKLERRAAGDLSVWVTLFTIAVLSPQRYKESRYLLAIMPLVAAVGGASVVVSGAWIADRLRFLKGKASEGVRTGALVAAGAAFVWVAWGGQAAYDYERFASIIRGFRAIPTEAAPYVVGSQHPWLITSEEPVLHYSDGLWRTRGGVIVGMPGGPVAYMKRASALVGKDVDAGKSILEPVQFLISNEVRLASYRDPFWRMLSERFVVADGFLESSRPRRPTFLLRRAKEGEPRLLWTFESRDPKGVEPLVRYERGLELLEVALAEMPSSPGVLRLDTVWRSDRVPERAMLAFVSLDDPLPWKLDPAQLMMADRFWIVPQEPEERKVLALPGATLRIRRYLPFPGRPPGEDLPVRLMIAVADEAGSKLEAELRPESPEALSMGLNKRLRPDIRVPVAKMAAQD